MMMFLILKLLFEFNILFEDKCRILNLVFMLKKRELNKVLFVLNIF